MASYKFNYTTNLTYEDQDFNPLSQLCFNKLQRVIIQHLLLLTQASQPNQNSIVKPAIGQSHNQVSKKWFQKTFERSIGILESMLKGFKEK